jgi:RNA polymerase sigma factor (sigma-70 family)
MNALLRNIVKKCKILPKEKLIELWKKWKEDGDQEAYHNLILSQLRLAYQLADRFRRFYPTEFEEDVKSEATLAVISALHWWKPEKGCLSTITTIIVQQRICKYLITNKHIIRIPYYLLRKLNQIEREIHRHVQELISGLSYLNQHSKTVKIIHDPPEDLIYQEERNRLLEALEKLDEIEKEVVMKKFGINGKAKTDKYLARKYNLTEDGVNEVVNRAIEKLRTILGESGG